MTDVRTKMGGAKIGSENTCSKPVFLGLGAYFRVFARLKMYLKDLGSLRVAL